jgi:hypothetical protein
MISVVNGYVCASSCEAASARQGKDPNAPPGTPAGTSSKTDKTSGFAGQAATMFDGVFKDLAAVSTITAASNAAPSTGTRPSVNLLA